MRILYLCIGACMISGCMSSGAFLSANQTIVNLNEGNYSVIATDVTGESESAYIVGFSFSNGFAANTIALARVDGAGALYASALEDLWKNYEEDNGQVAGQGVALSNVRYDADILNLFIYTRVKITVRADIIEFD